MRDVLSRRLAVALLLTPLLSTASCDRRHADDAKTLHFINRGDIFTLDLNEMSYAQDIRVTYLIREGLYAPTGPQQTPVAAGATGYDVSADQRVYTFHLRPEAKWSNGDPVTSADYVFSWRHMLEQPGEYTSLFYYVAGAEAYENDYAAGKTPAFAAVGIAAPDPLTLRVTLKSPVAYFLDLVAFTPFYPRNERSMDRFKQVDTSTGHVTYDAQYTRPPNVVCNGPFVLTDWKFKRILRFTRNPFYWDGGHVGLNEVDMLVNDNNLSAYLQYRADAVDWISEVPGDLGPELHDAGEPGLKTSTSFGTAFLSLNCQPKLPTGEKNPLADVRVRQALAMAIDKSFITEKITRMGEAVAITFVPPGTLPGYVSLPGLAHDPGAAQKLLADAGYVNGGGFPHLSILYNTENTNRTRFAQVIKQQWKDTLGINVEIEGVEGGNFKQRVSHKQFAIATLAWYGDYPDVSTFTDKYLAASIQNESTYFSPQYEALLATAATEPDAAKRTEDLRQAEHLLNTDVPIIPLYHYVNVTLIGPRVRGLSPNPRSITDWKAVSVAEAGTP